MFLRLLKRTIELYNGVCFAPPEIELTKSISCLAINDSGDECCLDNNLTTRELQTQDGLVAFCENNIYSTPIRTKLINSSQLDFLSNISFCIEFHLISIYILIYSFIRLLIWWKMFQKEHTFSSGATLGYLIMKM